MLKSIKFHAKSGQSTAGNQAFSYKWCIAETLKASTLPQFRQKCAAIVINLYRQSLSACEHNETLWQIRQRPCELLQCDCFSRLYP